MCVSVEPSLWWHGGLVKVVALIAALAGLDEHHRPVEAFAIRASEGDAGGARATGRAAPAIPANTTVVGPVQAGAPAAGVGQTVWLRGLMGTRALPSFLWGEKEERRSEISVPVRGVTVYRHKSGSMKLYFGIHANISMLTHSQCLTMLMFSRCRVFTMFTTWVQ